eukprot:11254605-Ditylum_brightwellii.AAC.1
MGTSPYDLTIGLNMGSVTRDCHEAQYQERKDAYNIQQTCKMLTKIQLKQALPKWLLNEIEDCTTGLKNVTIIGICFD